MARTPSPSSVALRTQALAILRSQVPELTDMSNVDIEANKHWSRLADIAAWKIVEAEAVQLLVAGYSTAEVAKRFGVTDATVRARSKRFLQRTAKNAGTEVLRARELLRLEAMTKKLWPMLNLDDSELLADGTVKPPSMAAFDKLLAISGERRKLMGLDLPVTKHIEITGEITQHAVMKAADLAVLMELQDRIALGGMGSGRVPDDSGKLQLDAAGNPILDAILVDDDDDSEIAPVVLDGSGPSTLMDDDSDSDSDLDWDDVDLDDLADERNGHSGW